MIKQSEVIKMPMLQIYLDDKEYAKLKAEARKHELSARKFASKLLFRRMNAELTNDMMAEIRAVYTSNKSKAFIMKEYGISRYKLNRILANK